MVTWIALTLRNYDGRIARISSQVDTLNNDKKYSTAIHTQLSNMDYDLGTSVDEIQDEIWKLSNKLDSLNTNAHKHVRKRGKMIHH